MVRLVFRPYTQVRRTICTSVSLRASTRVSPGFALLRHSSPSFGSQRLRSSSDPRGPGDAAAGEHPASRLDISLSLRTSSLNHSRTRAVARLLGPCFKTGRRQPFPPGVQSARKVQRTRHGHSADATARQGGRALCTRPGPAARPRRARRQSAHHCPGTPAKGHPSTL